MTAHGPDILGWGALATLAMTVVMSGSQGVGWTRISLPYLVGTVFTSNRDRALLLGLGVHVALGIAVAFGYAWLFGQLGGAHWWLGALLGGGQGVALLVAGLPVLAAVHPRMASKHQGPTPTRLLEPPGFVARNYGPSTAWVTLVAHISYGLVLGSSLR